MVMEMFLNPTVTAATSTRHCTTSTPLRTMRSAPAHSSPPVRTSTLRSSAVHSALSALRPKFCPSRLTTMEEPMSRITMGDGSTYVMDGGA